MCSLISIASHIYRFVLFSSLQMMSIVWITSSKWCLFQVVWKIFAWTEYIFNLISFDAARFTARHRQRHLIPSMADKNKTRFLLISNICKNKNYYYYLMSWEPHKIQSVVCCRSHFYWLMSFRSYIFIDIQLCITMCAKCHRRQNFYQQNPYRSTTKNSSLFQTAVVATDHFDFLKASQQASKQTNLRYVFQSIDGKREQEREREYKNGNIYKICDFNLWESEFKWSVWLPNEPLALFSLLLLPSDISCTRFYCWPNKLNSQACDMENV